VSKDTLVVVGAEGVIYPLAPRGIVGDPALVGISFSTGLSSYRQYITASTGTSIWCASEVIELNRAYTQQYQVLYNAVSELVLIAPDPENGLNTVEIAFLHELCGTGETK